MWTGNARVTAAVVAVLLAGVSVCSAKVIYVDGSATGANNGSSWADAYKYLQDALADANSAGKPMEVCAAQGVYAPDRSGTAPNGTRDREATFQLAGGVTLKGGYAGFGQPDPNARDTGLYETILSGDLNGNDAQGPPEELLNDPSRQDNSFHVVRALYTYPSTSILLDGFTITGGNANGDHYTKASGGGIEGMSDVLKVQNCIVEFNSALDNGGGCAWVPTLSNCIIRNNYSRQGGALIGAGSLRSCMIENNAAQTGGGIAHPSFVEDESYIDCVIQGNRAHLGGGLYITNQVASCTGCLFVDNRASEDGGAVYIRNDCTCRSELSLNRCKLIGNKATGRGGALYQEGNPRVWLSNSLVYGGTAGADGGGLFCDLYQGMVGAGWCGVTNSTIVFNTAVGNGGGVRCIVSDVEYFCMINSILWANKDQTGFGTWDAQFTLSLAGTGTGAPLPAAVACSPMTYSCIQGWQNTYGGEGNIGENPLFKDAHGPDESEGTGDGDYHLKADSPCIDAGTNSGLGLPVDAPSALTDTGSGSEWLDLDGHSRILGGTVDMGAYELGIPRIIYVDDSADGDNDGSSWTDAYYFLQDALFVASSGDEVRIAQGAYKPDWGAQVTAGDREATFRLKSGVTIKGGYAGHDAPIPDARDIERFKTILSGDLNRDDGPGGTNVGDNSRHVVTGSGTDDTAIIDGVTITAGYADGIDGEFPFINNGAGMYNENGSPTLINCTFTQNIVVLYDYEYGGLGAAIYNLHSHPVIKNCTFRKNSTGGGHGVVHNESSSPMISDCVFRDNDGGGMEFQYETGATVSRCSFIGNVSGYGSGVNCEYDSSPVIRDCVFVGNTAWYDGGALRCYEGCYPTVSNCIFAGNKAVIQNGGAISTLGSSPTLTNCTFTANNAARQGGAMFCYEDSHPKVANCILWGNSAADGAQIALTYHQSPGHDPSTTEITVSYSNVQGGPQAVSLEERCKLNWGPGNTDAHPRFVLPGFWDPNATPENADDDFWVNGDYHLKSRAGRWDASEGRWTIDEVTSPCIDAGDPLGPIGLEPFPNGGIVNMGAYGGTAEASKSYFNKPPCELIVAGDINGDCEVDFKDFAIMALHWLEHNQP